MLSVLQRIDSTVKNANKLREFEDSFIRKSSLSYREKLKIFDALYMEALKLGIFPSENPLEGLDVKIRMVRILSGRRNND